MKAYQVPGQDALIRQLQQAQQLQAAPAPQGQAVGRFYVPPSVTQRLASILKNVKGDEMARSAEAGMAQAQQQAADARQRAMLEMLGVKQPPTTQAGVEQAFAQRQAGNREALGLPDGGWGAQATPVPPPSVQTGPVDMPRQPQMDPQMIARLASMVTSGDPVLQQQAMQMWQDMQQYMRTRGDQLADTADARRYQAGIRDQDRQWAVDDRKDTQQFQRGMQDDSQRFTAGQNDENRAIDRARMEAEQRAREEAKARQDAAAERAAWTYDETRGIFVNKMTGQTRIGTDPSGQPLDPKMSEAQKKQLSGIDALGDAIDAYTQRMQSWSRTDMLNPQRRAEIATYYNNMMLQAKEAYNLGVLNGPDLDIMTAVVSNPTSWTSAMLDNETMIRQAETLKGLMATVRDRVRRPGVDQQVQPVQQPMQQPAGPRSDIPPTTMQPQATRVLRFDANGNLVQ